MGSPPRTVAPAAPSDEDVDDTIAPSFPQSLTPNAQSGNPLVPISLPTIEGDQGHDRIPVRLSGNRRAWLVIPEPFFEADKKRLKAQIDLLLTEDDEIEEP